MPLPLVSHFGNHSPVNGAPVLMAFKCPTPVLSPSTTPSDLSCFCSCSATHSSLAMSIHGHRFAFLSFPFHSIPCHSNPIRLAFVGLAAFALWPLSQPGQVPFMWPEPASQPASQKSSWNRGPHPHPATLCRHPKPIHIVILPCLFMAYAVAQVFGSCVCVLFSFWLENNGSAWMSGCPSGWGGTFQRAGRFGRLFRCLNSIWNHYRIGHVTGAGPE